LKTTGKVVGQRTRRVQRAGVQPDTRRTKRPRFLRRSREHRFTDATSDRGSNEAEIRDLGGAVVVLDELEEAGRFFADKSFPDADARLREMRRELIVGPRVAIVPVISVADGVIEPTIMVDCDRIAEYEPKRRVWTDC